VESRRHPEGTSGPSPRLPFPTHLCTADIRAAAVTIRAFRCCSPHHGGPSYRVKPSYTLGWSTPLASGPAPVSESRPTTRWTADTLLYTMLSGWWVEAAALVAAFVIATATVPAGVSGAVLLLPFQVSILGTPSPAVTPTNLLYNVVATPGALRRYWRQGQRGGRLARPLLVGTLPGVVVGSIVRVELLAGPRPFDVVVSLVLIPWAAGFWSVAFPPRQGISSLFQTARSLSWQPQSAVLAVFTASVGGQSWPRF
jgi:hypothetical protein